MLKLTHLKFLSMIQGDPTCGNEESEGKNVKKEEMEGK
jgi:hypothetical protein